MLFINPDECTDCEACALECPTSAIFYEDRVPGEWAEYILLNSEMVRRCPKITEKQEPYAK
ncbi:MAG: ferredoxin family protein [Planctomycetaceae bacterium]